MIKVVSPKKEILFSIDSSSQITLHPYPNTMFAENKFFYVAFLLLISVHLSWSQDSLSGVNKFLDSHTSIEYVVQFHKKGLMENDTVSEWGRCLLVRDPLDSLFGSAFEISTKDSVIIYMKDSLYLIDRSDSVMSSYLAKQRNFISSSYLSYLLDSWFIKPYSYSSSDSVEEVHNSSGLQILQHIVDSSSGVVMDVSISWNNKNQISEYQTKTSLLTYQQFVNLHFSNVELSTESKIKVIEDSLMFLKRRFPHIESEKPVSNKSNGIVVGQGFSLEELKVKSPLATNELKDVVLYDFWYRNCYPCWKSFPVIDSIGKVYESEISVVGINTVDSYSTGNEKEELDRFLELHKVSYPNVFVSENLKIKPQAFPCFVITQKNKVKAVLFGYNEELYEALKTEIEKLIP